MIMKKLVLCLLVLIMQVSFVACANEDVKEEKESIAEEITTIDETFVAKESVTVATTVAATTEAETQNDVIEESEESVTEEESVAYEDSAVADENVSNYEPVIRTYNGSKATHTHKYSKKMSRRPTCGWEGTYLYRCACGDSYEESIPKLPEHFMENGVCTVCGLVVMEEHTHIYKDEVTVSPTCQTEGLRTFTCACKDSYTEVIAPCKHFGVWTDNGGKWKYVSACYACHKPLPMDTPEGEAEYERHMSTPGPCFLAGTYFPVQIWDGPLASYTCKWCGVKKEVEIFHHIHTPGLVVEDYFD